MNDDEMVEVLIREKQFKTLIEEVWKYTKYKRLAVYTLWPLWKKQYERMNDE